MLPWFSRSRAAAVAAIALWALGAAPLSAQSTLGVVLGAVRDASGGSVAGATVKLTNVGENTSRESSTGADGAYEFQNVKPGVYTVEVSATGFRRYAAREFAVEARQTVRVDAPLEIGEVTEVVEVVASAGVIATDSPAIASSLGAEQVLNLPANVRAGGSTSPYLLIGTLPGVQPDNGSGFGIQGGIPAQSESSVDGISITRVTGNSPNRALFPSVESIAEIRVQGVGNQAEYGQPGDVTTISKGGTNDFHGALFWYHQNRALDSRSFNQPTLPAKVANTFGGTVGGPVRLPGYDGRNRTFFLFTWESFRLPQQGTVQNTVPTELMRRGDFTGEGIAVVDPLNGQPFPNAVIPASRVSPIAAKIIPFYPLPNFGAANRVVQDNFRVNRPATIESDQFDVRIDQTFGSRHMLFGRYTQKDNPRLAPNNLTLPEDTVNDDHKQIVVSDIHTFKSNLFNEFRFGWSYAPSDRDFPFDGRAFTNDLNLQDVPRNIFYNGLPNFAIEGLTSFAKSRPGFSRSTSIQFIDNLTWVRGGHSFKFGADIRRLRAESSLGFTTGNDFGDYAFSGNFTRASFGDFLLGAPAITGFAQLQSDNDGRAVHYKFYAQDSWRITPKLTMDYGVRWEFHPGFTDAGLNIGNFDRSIPRTGRVVIPSDPAAGALIGEGIRTTIAACPGPGANGIPCTPIVSAKEAGLPEGLRENYYNQFLPRLGLAYRWNDKTTVRLSGGVYNMITLGSVFFSLTGTVQSDVRSFVNVGPDGRPLFFLPQTRPPGQSGVRAGTPGTFEFRTANQIDFRPPQMYQWALSIDRQLARDTGLRLSYIGNKGTHMPWAPDINQTLPSTRFFAERSVVERPFPHWGLIYSRDAGANTTYNAMQLEINRRAARGLTFNGAYTLAKNLGDNAGPAPDGFAGETGGGRVTNSLDRRADRGDVYATRRHRFVATALYELPFGKGRRFLTNAPAAVEAILGGWSFSNIVILQSGPFLTPQFTAGDPSGTNAPRRGTQRPDRVGAANGSVDNPTRESWLDRSAFVCPGRVPGAANQFDCAIGVNPTRDPAPIGRFGNAGVGIVTGPGSFTWNAALAKRFQLTERAALRLEGSFTNLPNYTNLADPELRINNNNFGRITSVRRSDFGGNRTGQLGLRLEF